jgi:hypothetical protein
MLAARLSRAIPRVAQAVRGRAMSTPTITEQLSTVKDVKVKDIPQWASSVQKDPKTEAAVQVCFSIHHFHCCWGCFKLENKKIGNKLRKSEFLRHLIVARSSKTQSFKSGPSESWTFPDRLVHRIRLIFPFIIEIKILRFSTDVFDFGACNTSH